MNARTTSIIAYLTWVGLLIAILAGDKDGAKFHINQEEKQVPLIGGIKLIK